MKIEIDPGEYAAWLFLVSVSIALAILISLGGVCIVQLIKMVMR